MSKSGRLLACIGATIGTLGGLGIFLYFANAAAKYVPTTGILSDKGWYEIAAFIGICILICGLVGLLGAYLLKEHRRFGSPLLVLSAGLAFAPASTALLGFSPGLLPLVAAIFQIIGVGLAENEYKLSKKILADKGKLASDNWS